MLATGIGARMEESTKSKRLRLTGDAPLNCLAIWLLINYTTTTTTRPITTTTTPITTTTAATTTATTTTQRQQQQQQPQQQQQQHEEEEDEEEEERSNTPFSGQYPGIKRFKIGDREESTTQREDMLNKLSSIVGWQWLHRQEAALFHRFVLFWFWLFPFHNLFLLVSFVCFTVFVVRSFESELFQWIRNFSAIPQVLWRHVSYVYCNHGNFSWIETSRHSSKFCRRCSRLERQRCRYFSADAGLANISISEFTASTGREEREREDREERGEEERERGKRKEERGEGETRDERGERGETERRERREERRDRRDERGETRMHVRAYIFFSLGSHFFAQHRTDICINCATCLHGIESRVLRWCHLLS